MTDKEWRKTLAGLDEDFQLTPYKQKLYNNKNGSIWYVAEQNALCLIPSNVRQDDELNQLGLHNYELSHACDNDNEIIRGFAAIYARLFRNNTDLLRIIERDEKKRMELITVITERLSDMEYDKRESINYWQETLERENEKSLWKLLNIDFYNLKQLYGLYMRLNLHQIERPLFDPTNYSNAFHKLVWLTDGENFIERINDIKIQQVLEYDYTTFQYGLHNEQCKKNSAYASYFTQELLNYCCQWTIYRICLKNSDAWNDLSTLQRSDLLLAIVHHSVRYDNKELALSFVDLTAGELYKTYLLQAYQKWKEHLEKNPTTALYADDDSYIWNELYKEEKEAFESNKLMEILPAYLYEHLQNFAQGLLMFIKHHHLSDEPENERAPKTKQQAVPQWQQILKDLAVPDEYCKQSYGAHNVRIAMYIKALEDCKLLTVVDRQGANSLKFYTTLSDIFQYTILQNSVEWQINHLLENEKNKHIYENEILPLVKDSIKPQK